MRRAARCELQGVKVGYGDVVPSFSLSFMVVVLRSEFLGDLICGVWNGKLWICTTDDVCPMICCELQRVYLNLCFKLSL